MNNSNNTTLSFDKLSIKVHLGVSDNEHVNSQEIYLSLKLISTETPKACLSDNIEDAICYDRLSQTIKEFCIGKEFKLIECLTYQLYKVVKNFINDPNIRIWLKVDKYPTSMKDLLGAVSFTYHD